ncbi:acetylcholinesterase-like isoform X1 [Haliotis rufescens]|uniref:acetylcholinesterase-like isoform X1 n=1 Tax=Haliotis rufescens TaxID=6454 RepID=UPI00201EA0FA|nr:acetylcholinesterase-like isoform X1 [Haliotis rufescens]
MLRHRIYVTSVVLILCCVYITDGQEVNTSQGRLRGTTLSVRGKHVDVFHGIPFAKPPVGNLRFKHPSPPDSWDPEIRNATQEKPPCLQPRDIFSFPEDYRKTPGNLSEDCLYLSLWRPSNISQASNLAVMVFIYGGGWGIGSIRLGLYNGQYLAAENDIILVSINYRLGPLGFGYLGPDTIPGNMGLMDQRMALKWVNDNIARFGGDVNRITIFGESAGAVSVGLHLLSPLSRDLFKYGVLESGSPNQPVSRQVYQDHDTARSYVRTFGAIVGCTGSTDADLFTCLQKVEADAITPAFVKGLEHGRAHSPVIDKYFMPDDPLTLMKTGQFKKTNILQGCNKDESTVLVLPLMTNFTRDGLTREKYLEIMKSYTRFSGPESKAEALRLFYEEMQDPVEPINYIQVLNNIRDDLEFTCRAVAFSSYYSEHNDTYMYSFNHRLSTSSYPSWIGATHTYELEMVFGLPLDRSLGFQQDEVELSRTIMTYWTNFAKTGNPNKPVAVRSKWAVFKQPRAQYMSLDVGDNLATRQRLHHQRCNFINNILPLVQEVSKDKDMTPASTAPCTNASLRSSCARLNIMALMTGVLLLRPLD